MIAKIVFLAVVGASLSNVVAARYFIDFNITDTHSKDLNTIIDILKKPRVPEKYQNGFRIGQSNGFSWKSCGSSDDIVTFSSISVKPDKLVFPGQVTVAVSGKINTDLEAPIQTVVDLKKKVGGTWVQIPCISQLGSCTYDDICDMFKRFCPSPMPCKCPFKAGPIDVPSTTRNVPYSIPEGDYSMNVKATHNDKEVLCLDMTVAIG